LCWKVSSHALTVTDVRGVVAHTGDTAGNDHPVVTVQGIMATRVRVAGCWTDRAIPGMYRTITGALARIRVYDYTEWL
jgi:hypothetical protein